MTHPTKDHLTYQSILTTVRSWSATQRFTLVQDILATLAPQEENQKAPRHTLPHARGLLKTDRPAPSDQDIETLLKERRQDRYGLPGDPNPSELAKQPTDSSDSPAATISAQVALFWMRVVREKLRFFSG